MSKHAIIECTRRMGIEARYSSRNWSALFVCPVCGAFRRANLNFLGSRHTLVCDGEKILRMPKADICAKAEGRSV